MAFFSKGNRPRIQEIFLSDENRKVRIILLCIFLAIAVTALIVGLVELLNTDPGWQEIEISQGLHCGEDFTFQYNFGSGGRQATAARKELTNLYTQCASEAFWMFTPDSADQNNSNVYAINHNVGQIVTVHPVLYNALEQMQAYGNRSHYLGPVYVVYKNVCFSQDDFQAADWDPTRDAEQAQYVGQLAAFARDEEAVNVELLGNNQVRLQVSEEYRKFAQENEIENFIDFNWMKNAFIIDYFADAIVEKGYTQGFFISKDGFSRNLTTGVPFQLNLLDRENGTVYPAGTYAYNGPLNAVAMRSYANSVQSAWYYHAYADGTITSSYADIQDGISRCAISDLLCYSSKAGCADILLQMMPAYIRDELDTQLLMQLNEKEIFSIWGEDFTIYHTEPDAELTNLMNRDGISYHPQMFS